MRPVRAFVPAQDAIGVFCPSHSISEFPRRLDRGIAHLRETFGSVVKMAPHALGRLGRLSGDTAQRTSDLEALLRDPEVGLIMCGTGGYASLDVALALDLDLFCAHPKPIVGFSDATALLLDLHRRSGRVTFHGPALLPSFGEAAILPWQGADLLRMVTPAEGYRTVTNPPLLSETFQFWDRDDDTAPARQAPPGPRGFGTQVGRGPLIGGNLDTLVMMIAAGRMPDTSGAIVFWEAAFGQLEKVRRDLTALDLAGIFANAAGMVVGLPFCVDDGATILGLATELAARRRLPMLFGLSIGHTSPILTLPLGAMATLDPNAATLTIMEDTVV
ncbi:S66 peptidase family protein [Bradyrhizobium sp. HKCCYLS3013]|uniref:S66 peptidase family protein n=1 Tax=Bradyrhizobium sp. HKCCYLS3013 TaxID=3420735 RepID=UPI003EBC8485